MNRALEIAKKNQLWAIIKKVGIACGETDMDFLKEYAAEMVKEHGLDKSLTCFIDLETQLKFIKLTK